MVERDFPEQGLRVRRPATLHAWLSAYAAATATTASYNSLLDAATAGESTKPAKTTTTAYRDVLSQLWLLDPVPGWVPNRNHLRRLTQLPNTTSPTPLWPPISSASMPDALLRGQSTGPDIARDGTLLGALFESLVTLSVRVYAQACEATVHHLRTRDGDREVDLIIQRRDQRVVALEVKLDGVPGSADVRHLLWLPRAIGRRAPRRRRHHGAESTRTVAPTASPSSPPFCSERDRRDGAAARHRRLFARASPNHAVSLCALKPLTWSFLVIRFHVDRLVFPDNAEVASSILASPTSCVLVDRLASCGPGG